MSIATKTGDQGQTSLYDGTRVPKSHPRIELVGTLDELNAHLGLSRAALVVEELAFLKRIQADLLELGALVANPKKAGSMQELLEQLEGEFKGLEALLPPLTQFLLPGGHPAAAHLHVARTVCRRAERILLSLEQQPEASLPYLNRLSDYCFQAARLVNQCTKTEETKWQPL